MRILASLAFALLFSAAVHADTPHPEYTEKLDQLFGQLHSTTDAAEARLIETKIRLIWSSNSTDQAVHQLTVASFAMELGDLKAAQVVLDELVKQHPDFAEAWNHRATLYYMEAKYPESLSDIDQVLKLEPRHFGALSGKGACLRAEGRDADALEAMKEAIAIDPFILGLGDAIKEMEKKKGQEL